MTDTTEPLDLDACVANLNAYVAAGDARSCRDIALAVIAENRALRRDLSAREGSEGARLAIAEGWWDQAARLREELDGIGDLVYRFSLWNNEDEVRELLALVHDRAKRAVGRG